MVEIGGAYTKCKPIFLAFANEALSKDFYFVKQLATVAVITPDVMAAWKLFARWQANGTALPPTSGTAATSKSVPIQRSP